MFAAIRERLRKREVQTDSTKTADWMSVVRRMANDEPVTEAEIEAVCESVNSGKSPKCPINPEHGHGTAKPIAGNRLACFCTECGWEWEAEKPFGSIGPKSIDELEADVALLKKRIGHSDFLASVKALTARGAEIDAILRAANDELQAAHRKMKELGETYRDELLLIESRTGSVNHHQHQLCLTAPKFHPELKAEQDQLIAERRAGCTADRAREIEARINAINELFLEPFPSAH